MLSIDGKSIGSSGRDGLDKARELLSDLKVGQNVQVVYARAGKTGKANIKVDNIGRVMMFSDRDGEFAPRAYGHGKRMMMGGPDTRENHMKSWPLAIAKNPARKTALHRAFFEALRWQGLNLASLDAQLGRYFGTEKGVLVISASPDMKNLQSGDVIQRVETTSTQSPRDVMRVLREKESR